MIGRLGEYELLSELGQGGMGVVYRARARDPERLVAIKVLTGSPDPVSLLRFKQEAEAAARVRHPNLATLHGSGTADGRHYIVMDLIEGRSLGDLLREGTPAPEQSAAWIATIARGVAAIHAAGLLHRDLKPSNVLLDAEGRVYLTDFGVALDLTQEQRLSLTGELLGTPCYMAPEQAEGKRELDTRADVYGLGATLYHLLTGSPPFRGTTISVLTQVVETPPVDPCALRPGLDPELAAICMRALAKRPSERPASAADLAAELESWCGREPASPPRRPALVLALGAAASLALLSAIVAGAIALASSKPTAFNPSEPALDLAKRPRPTLEQVLQLPRARQAAAAGRLDSKAWITLTQRLGSQGADMDGKQFETLLALHGHVNDPESVRDAKAASLEAGAGAWGRELSKSPDGRRLDRLCRFARQSPRVWAGPALSRALSAALDQHLGVLLESGPASKRVALVRFEDRVFYELDPRPRWSQDMQNLVKRVTVVPKAAPRLALSQVRYWTRTRRLSQEPNDWLDRALEGRPRSAIRAALQWLRDAKRARQADGRVWLALLKRLLPICKQTGLLPDLGPRHTLELGGYFFAHGQKFRSLPEAARREAGRLLAELGLTVAKRLIGNPYVSLGSDLVMAMDIAVIGQRLLTGEEGVIALLRAAEDLLPQRARVPLRKGEGIQYGTRVEYETRLARAQFRLLISGSYRRLGRRDLALSEIGAVTANDQLLSARARSACRALHAELLLEDDRLTEAAALVSDADPKLLRDPAYERVAIKIARLQGDEARARRLRDAGREARRRQSEFRRRKRSISAEPGETDEKKADK